MPALLREPRAAYGSRRLLESDLWRLWEGQRFPKAALVTAQGDVLHVIFRGRPGAGPGPDFRGAIISSPGGLLCGDVELHVRTSDFRRHGHHADPAYAEVVLHVVFFHDETGQTALPGGGTAPVVALGGPRAERWLQAPARWGEPCRSAVERMGAAGAGEKLDRLGGMRFRQKSAAWHRRLAAGMAIEEALWSGLLEGLAYGGDRQAFRRLAEAAAWSGLRAVLLPETEALRERRALALLTSAYAGLGLPPQARAARPGNSPEKRLEGAAALAARFAGPGLAASLIGPLAEPDSAARLLVDALTVPRLVGRARAIELAGNVVLPLAAALCGQPASFGIEAVFARLPLPACYGAVRHLHEVIRPHVRPDMRRQQGMLYLLHQYCTQGGCGNCPLS
jgi:hypothetical protein